MLALYFVALYVVAAAGTLMLLLTHRVPTGPGLTIVVCAWAGGLVLGVWLGVRYAERLRPGLRALLAPAPRWLARRR